MIDNSQVQRIKVQLERLRATTAFSGNSNSNNNSNSSIQYDYKLAVKNRVKTNIGQIISTSTDTGINTIVRFPEGKTFNNSILHYYYLQVFSSYFRRKTSTIVVDLLLFLL